MKVNDRIKEMEDAEKSAEESPGKHAADVALKLGKILEKVTDSTESTKELVLAIKALSERMAAVEKALGQHPRRSHFPWE